MKRIGLTQRVETVESYGERRDCLDQQWTKFIEELPAIPLLLPNLHSEPRQLINEMSLDGVILTGGNTLVEYAAPDANTAPERDATEKALLDYCVEIKIPMIGVCRGMQLLNHYFGGSLEGTVGHTAVRHPIDLAGAEDCLAFSSAEEVNSFHDLGIALAGLAPELQMLATGPDNSVEAVKHTSLPLWGVMWHPEREVPFVDQDLNFFRNVLLS
jgi:putative glutamine amidotransferase